MTQPNENQQDNQQQNSGAQGNQQQTGAQGNGFDQDKFFERLGQEFGKFQQQAQQGQQSQGSQQSSASGNDQILQELQALPEKFANVIKEMNPGAQGNQQQNGAQGNQQQNGAQDNNQGGQQEPGKKTFAQRWFS